MKDLRSYLICEAETISDFNSPLFDEFLEYIKKYEKSLRIGKPEQERYKKKGAPITKEIAQDLLSKRLYNNVSVRYTTQPEFFLEVCQKYDIQVNMTNLGYGKAEVIQWGIPNKKTAAKDIAKEIYWDDNEIVLGDKTVGYRVGKDFSGIQLFDEYKEYAEEILKVFKRKYKGLDWHIVEK